MNLSASARRLAILLKTATRSLVLCASWKLAFSGGVLHAQAPSPEYTSKGTYLAKITQFVKWPPAADPLITVGVLGDDFIGNALAGKIGVKRSKRVEDLKDCKVIFIGKSELDKLGEILAALEGTNILTVGESEDFAKLGGMIGLLMDGEQVRMEINPGAAKRAGLGIDLRLLKLASRVVSS